MSRAIVSAIWLAACGAPAPAVDDAVVEAVVVDAAAAPPDALIPYQVECTGGDLYFCHVVAVGSLRGELGIPQDVGRARSLFERNCAVGYAHSCWLLADMIDDRARATTLLQRACDADDGDACASLAATWERADADDRRVVPLYRRACALRSTPGCFAMGRLSEAHSRRAAARYYRMACDGEDIHACERLDEPDHHR